MYICIVSRLRTYSGSFSLQSRELGMIGLTWWRERNSSFAAASHRICSLLVGLTALSQSIHLCLGSAVHCGRAIDTCMKLLTRYPSSGLSGLRPAACLQAVRDGSSTPAPKRASFLVRLPYYVFLASMAAVYYGYVSMNNRVEQIHPAVSIEIVVIHAEYYRDHVALQVISLNLRWMILHQGYIWLSFVFLSIFHFLFVMFMWSLLATVYRGPGAVGEVLTLKTGNNEDLEAGLPNESAPLMQNIEDPSSDPVNNASHHALAPNDQHTQPPASRWRQRPRSSSKSHSHTSTEDEDDAANQDYLELQPKLDYGDSSDEELEAGTSNSSNAKKKKDVEIIYPGTLGSRASLMAKANGKARFCRKCNVAKPDRAHHCSTCGFCVLKMDHHCPWIGGCVGFKNYKTFILFLFYADLLSIFTCATSLWVLIQVLDMDIEVRYNQAMPLDGLD